MELHYSNLNIYGVDFSHLRLTELMKIADQAEPFYRWVEKIFRQVSGRADSLEVIIDIEDRFILEQGVRRCFAAEGKPDVPKLFNGVGVP